MEALTPVHQALLDDIRDIARKHLLQVRIEFGHAVAQRLYGGSVEVLEDRLAHHKSGLKSFFAECAEDLEDLGVSERLLKESLAVWAVFVRLPERVKEALGVSHLVALTRVADLQTREILAEAAVRNDWSVRTLNHAIEAVAHGAWPDAEAAVPGLQPPAVLPEMPTPPPVDDGKAPSPGRLMQRFERTARDVADVFADFERVKVADLSPLQKERAREALGLVLERGRGLLERLQ